MKGPSIERVETGLIVAVGAIAAGAAAYEGTRMLQNRLHQAKDGEGNFAQPESGEHVLIDNSSNSGNFAFGELAPEYSR